MDVCSFFSVVSRALARYRRPTRKKQTRVDLCGRLRLCLLCRSAVMLGREAATAFFPVAPDLLSPSSLFFLLVPCSWPCWRCLLIPLKKKRGRATRPHLCLGNPFPVAPAFSQTPLCVSFFRLSFYPAPNRKKVRPRREHLRAKQRKKRQGIDRRTLQTPKALVAIRSAPATRSPLTTLLTNTSDQMQRPAPPSCVASLDPHKCAMPRPLAFSFTF